MSNYVMYGAEISYFSGKARSYLRWKDIQFEERQAGPKFYSEICIPTVGYPVIPVVVAPNGDLIQDTTLIIEHFEKDKALEPSFTPEGSVQNLVSHLIELFADDWLLIPAMHYRWVHDARTTLLEFGMNNAPGASEEKQRAIGEERSAMFRGFVGMLGAVPHMKETIEAEWFAVLKELEVHFRAHPYLLGERPCIGDFALVGALYAHMYRDATAGTLMRNEALSVARYVERMMWPSGEAIGEYLDGDTVPETLAPILKRMMREEMPCLVDVAKQLANWKEANPGEPIPRVIGMHKFTHGGKTAERVMMPYPLWMLDRAKGIHDNMSPDDRARATALLLEFEGRHFIDLKIPAPVKLEDYKIQWAC